MKCPLPKVPEIFFKPAQCLHDPSGPVKIPSSASGAIDSEVELAVIIGKDCKNIDVSSAMDFVLGYTAANDMTARDIQARTSQWSYSKGYDGFCPLGPVLVRNGWADVDVQNLAMKTTLNGDVLQNGNSSEMIFSIAEIVSYLSRVSICLDLIDEVNTDACIQYCRTLRYLLEQLFLLVPLLESATATPRPNTYGQDATYESRLAPV